MSSNLDTEKAVLGAILVAGKLPAELKTDDFYAIKHRIIFKAALNLGENLSLLALNEDLKTAGKLDEIGGPSYLVELCNQAAGEALIPVFIKEIKENAKQRQELGQAEEKTQSKKRPSKEKPAPIEIAESLCWQRHLIYCGESFYAYQGGVYRYTHEEIVRRWILEITGPDPPLHRHVAGMAEFRSLEGGKNFFVCLQMDIPLYNILYNVYIFPVCAVW